MAKESSSQPNKGGNIGFSPYVDFGNHVVFITSGHHILFIAMVLGPTLSKLDMSYMCFQTCDMTNDVTDLGSEREINNT